VRFFNEKKLVTMTRILSTLFLLVLLGWQFAAQAQTLTITPSSVEVITAGAKTRTFYALDDVYFQNTYTGGFTVRDAASGSTLFSGDTSEVTMSGASSWAAKHALLDAYCIRVPYDTLQHPINYLPRKGVNFLYKNSDATVKVVHSRSKNTIWSGTLASMVDGATASNALIWIRTVLQRDGGRSAQIIGPAATIASGAAAGASPTVAMSAGPTSGAITLTTGTTATTTGNLCVVTLPHAYDTMFVTVTAGNTIAATHVARVFWEQLTTTTFALKAAGTALSDATAYKWSFSVTGLNTTPAQ
jgi:hypothetical protein